MQYDLNSDIYDFSSDVVTEDIKRYFKEHNDGSFFSIFEVGMNGIRFDLLRVEPEVQYIRGLSSKCQEGIFWLIRNGGNI